jgi:hypothetical protein
MASVPAATRSSYSPNSYAASPCTWTFPGRRSTAVGEEVAQEGAELFAIDARPGSRTKTSGVHSAPNASASRVTATCSISARTTDCGGSAQRTGHLFSLRLGDDNDNVISGADIGRYVASLLSAHGSAIRGETIHLKSRDMIPERTSFLRTREGAP